MFGYTGVLILCFTVCYALEEQNNDMSEARLGTGFADVTDFSPVPFIIVIAQESDDSYYAMGVGVNKNFVLTTATVATDIQTAGLTTKLAYQGITDTANIATATPHVIKQSIPHADFATLGASANIGILRVCLPLSLATYVTIPSAGLTFTPPETVTMYSFPPAGGKLQFGVKITAVDSSCSSVTGYDSAAHNCLGPSATIFVDDTDKDKMVLVMKGTNFYGMIVSVDTTGTTEASLKVGTFTTWINTNAPATWP